MADPDSLHPVAEWAASGALALTGRLGGPPLLPRGQAATTVRRSLQGLGIDIPSLLGERAAYAGFCRSGPWSCGGSFRIMPSLDGHVGVSLARESDVELVSALVIEEVSDPWPALEGWLRETPSADAEDRLRMLGLPGRQVRLRTGERAGVVRTTLGSRPPKPQPLVVDLTALWAGPLCAHLLSRLGATVITVESVNRPDGMRNGSPGYYSLLHHGHRHVSLDLPRERSTLFDLISEADLVLESSRPRALRAWGIEAEDVVAAGTHWLSITAEGRASEAVGFGDDVAAGAGLVAADGPDLLPAGDAIADPLAGVAAACAAVEALAGEESSLIDVSMLHVSAESGPGEIYPHQLVQRRDEWWVECDGGASLVEEPRCRP